MKSRRRSWLHILRQALLPQGLLQASGQQQPPTWILDGCSPAAHAKVLQLGLLGAGTASVALSLPGLPPGPLLHKVDQWRQRVLLWHLRRKKMVQHATSTGSFKGDAVNSGTFPAELTRPVLLSGGSGFLLPQTAHGCPRVKSKSLMYDLATPKVNMGELTAIIRWVPASALAPVLSQLWSKGGIQ